MDNRKFKTRKSTKISKLDGKSGTAVIGVVNSGMVGFVWNDQDQIKLMVKELARIITAQAHLETVQQALPEQTEDEN